MKNKRTLLFLFVGLLVIGIISVAISNFRKSNQEIYTSQKNQPHEYLQIVGVRFLNGKNRLDGAESILSLYSIDEHKIIANYTLGKFALYPVACIDFAHNKIYYSGSDNNLYDNLYVYDISTKQSKQLTNDKMLFNDLFMVGDKIIGNVAPEGKTCLRPTIFYPEQNKVEFYNYNDDDTWFHSLSYNAATGKLLTLTCSDKEMRSERVSTQTFICPKKVNLMNPDFSDVSTIYSTEAFEIRETRQLDADHIIMITDKHMGSGGPRQLQVLDLKNNQLQKLNIDGLIEPQSVFPDKSGEHLYILGRSKESMKRPLYISLFDYDMKKHTLTDLLADYQFPTGYSLIVNFTYVYYPNN